MIGTEEREFREVLGGVCEDDDLTAILAHLVQNDVLGVKDDRYYPVHATLKWNLYSNVPNSSMIRKMRRPWSDIFEQG